MSSKKLTDFPDVEAKLQKPSKQSAFEKQKADAEAKRKREEAETAAVYASFVKSFDNEDDDDDEINAIARGGNPRGFGGPGGPPRGGFGGSSVPGKRHFGAPGGPGTAMKSGPGSLGPVPTKSGPGSLGPSPTGYGFKRGFDRSQNFHRELDSKRTNDARGRLGFHDDDKSHDRDAPKPVNRAFETSDDEGEGTNADSRAEERAVAKPTLRLSNLPPGTSPAVIKALIPPNLSVENVRLLPARTPSANERKSMAAIVILSQETPASDIDAAVSSLQNRYLGYGFHLSLHRHLSSAVSSTVATASLSTSNASQAFGAKSVPQESNENSHHPGQMHRSFAPPTFYGPPGAGMQRSNLLHVPVQAPRDIKQLQLIHKVVESVLEHGPDFEALLMSRPDVQREEKWAWLWDARSEGGVWYRWRLWEVMTGWQPSSGKQGLYLPLFEGSHAWRAPEKQLAYEYTTSIDEFVSDPEYNSSEEEDFEDEGHKPPEGGPSADNDKMYLNPLDKAKLAHLLARLPTTLSRIRKGDIARITTLAITHASRGADEIVDMIVANVERPFALTAAKPEYKQSGARTDGENDRNGLEGSSNTTPMPDDVATRASMAGNLPTETSDTSAASLVGLYVVSDILSSSATSGVRHSWRFRQLFESALREKRVFEHLGLMAERMKWGRLRAEKWKRSIGLVLSLWEGWSAFPVESQEQFVKTFENPPSQKEKGLADDADENEKKTGRWKSVEEGKKGFKPVDALGDREAGYDPARGDGMEVDDVDGDAMEDDDEYADLMDEDIDGVPMSEGETEPAQAALDGSPMDEDNPAPIPQPSKDVMPQAESKQETTEPPPAGSVKVPRRRMRAVDLFADSDSESDK